MVDLDVQSSYLIDHLHMWQDLRDLAGSGPSVHQHKPEPYGVVGWGEAWWAGQLGEGIFGRDLVFEGTQLVLDGGFEHQPYTYLDPDHTVHIGTNKHCHYPTPSSALSPYRLLRTVLLLTKRTQDLERIDKALLLARHHIPRQHSSENPFKQAAYSLANHTPVWISSDPLLPIAMQQGFARIAKRMSVPLHHASLEMMVTGLSQDHRPVWFDDEPDHPDRLHICRLYHIEPLVLQAPRQLEGLGGLATVMHKWYTVLWISYYSSVLQGLNPTEIQTPLEVLEESRNL